jgi:hypothetical protein
MGYYIRVLALGTAIPTLDELKPCLPAGQELRVASGQESDWWPLVLSHKTGQGIALIERNPVIPGELGEEELTPWKMAVLDERGKWIALEMKMQSIRMNFSCSRGSQTSLGHNVVLDPARNSCGADEAATNCGVGLYTRCASCYCFFPYRHPCARRLGL